MGTLPGGRRCSTTSDAGFSSLDIRCPAGYNQQQVTLALEVPPTYPGAQIDMFYVFPSLALNSGQALECTQVQEAICGLSYQRWSRHRSDACQWRPDSDNVVTHLALVESALAKEVQQ